ncbi:hypothetical protein GUITHDRAFT_99580 [Guillardia theta CCMP2712]|uniref:PDZ domain-containing protein n=1 Tax=Guillardia theta (strain CCMP2712) TaxID=905079 RepID=L1K2V0_GUITC|nr:hypothetical protein GUITHDRAFT_99580 [Guillardia theta CCMP2712]EKX54929.1 hypothetical protein GUITHDRAFT_99580 [Guillardia theta CCMP2712]|eukprot:XP_005841909.1 hypothetical protein GUITHDRAFT_99580 [Guillardia theta CCMP2712]
MVVNMNLQSKDRNDISKTVWNQALSAFIAISLVFGQSHLEAKAAPPQTKVAPVQANNVAAEEKNSKIEEKVELFAEILKDIQNLYVEPVDLDKLTETGFNAMLSSLDPYTEFENVQAAQQMKVQTFGNYGGVGLVIAKPKNSKGEELPYINIMGAFEGYAFDAGLRAGDVLLSVNGKDVKDLPVDKVSELLKGDPGTSVKIRYSRPGIAEVQEQELKRRIVLLRDVPLGMMIGDEAEKIGYVKLQGFSSSAAAELAYVISQLQSKSPLNGLILDLRNNPGGLLTSAIKVSDLFIGEGKDIVTTRGRLIESNIASDTAKSELSQDENKVDKSLLTKSGQKSKTSSFETVYKAMPILIPAGNSRVAFHPPLLDPSTRLVVLVNKVIWMKKGFPAPASHVQQNTASASEIVAGALQDHDRAVIIGETTYGKGLVQQLQKIGKGGTQIKFTVGKYYTPSGRCIQSKTYKEAKNGFVGTEATAIAERKVFYTDNGRPVRDAGGIEPDIAMQPAQPGQLEKELEKRDTFFKFATEWQKKHVDDGEALAKGPLPVVTDEVYKEFQRYVEKEESEFEGPFDKSLELMQEALDQAGYGEAKNDVQSLQKHLSSLLMGEFDKNRKDIMKRLEIAIRQHYVPESYILSLSLADDEQVCYGHLTLKEKAYAIAKDGAQYQTVLGVTNKDASLTSRAN